MKRGAVLVIITTMVLPGCGATTQEMQQYYDAMNKSNEALIRSIEIQAASNTAARVQQMSAFTMGMNQAAMTESPTDDIGLAMAWGYQSAQPFRVEQPNLQQVRAPETGSEKVRAWTPIIGMAVPFLYPLVYGWSNSQSNSGTRISADNGASVSLDSGNSGSYNAAGNDLNQTTTVTDSDVIDNSENCADCGLEDEFDEGDEGEFVLEECLANPPGGLSPSGTPLLCEGCSCNTFSLGSCTCDDTIIIQ